MSRALRKLYCVPKRGCPNNKTTLELASDDPLGDLVDSRGQLEKWANDQNEKTVVKCPACGLELGRVKRTTVVGNTVFIDSHVCRVPQNSTAPSRGRSA